MAKYNWQQHSKKKQSTYIGASIFSPPNIQDYIREIMDGFINEPINESNYDHIHSQLQSLWPGAEIDINPESGNINITQRIRPQPIYTLGGYSPVEILGNRW